MRLLPVGFAVLFAVAHTQSPLYYSNQNQYFLHGAATAGVGDLSHDWLANTADPTPAFSAFVAFCLKHLGEWPFHAVFFLALMAYFLSAWWLVKPSRHTGPVFALLFTLLHAGIIRWASDRILGADYPWFFHCGLASQYILGAGLQPSVVGVALFASVAAYRHERPLLAVVLASGANLIHSTYLLPAALLIAGYLAAEARKREWRTMLFCSLIGSILVLPVVVNIFFTFSPDPSCFDQAQDILANVRIPHHTRPGRWFDWVAGLQVLWLVAGLGVLRSRRLEPPQPQCAASRETVGPPPSYWRPADRLFLPLCVTTALALIGTVAVLVTENPTLSLMFPWRITAVLVPVATTLLINGEIRAVEPLLRALEKRNRKLYEAAVRLLQYRRRRTIAIFSVLALTFGCSVYLFHLGYREPEAEDAALEYVAAHHQPGEVYLVPARFPKPATSRGVYSNTFTKPPDPSAVVYFEMARFRLFTKAALYVDFKAIPYKDTEVMEWHRRVSRCETWFASPDWDARNVVPELLAEGITHVVAPTKLGLKSARLEAIPLERGAYTVYRIWRVSD